MKKQEKIESEIEKTLNQFENVETLEPNHYLLTRIQQKLEEKNKTKFNVGVILKPAFFTLLFAVNLITTVWYVNSTDEYYSTDANQGLVEILSSDFNLENDQSDILIVK